MPQGQDDLGLRVRVIDVLTDHEAWFLASLVPLQVGPVQRVEDSVARPVTCTTHLTGYTLHVVGYTLRMVPPDPSPVQHTSLVKPIMWLCHSCYLYKTPHWLHLKMVTRESSPVQHTSLVTSFIWCYQNRHLHKTLQWLLALYGWLRLSYGSTRPVTCTIHLTGYTFYMVGYALHNYGSTRPVTRRTHLTGYTFLWLVTSFIRFHQTRHLHSTPNWLHLLCLVTPFIWFHQTRHLHNTLQWLHPSYGWLRPS